MKERTGFVSNSSSSSFIVKFDKDPTDINNLREMMGDCGVDPYGYAISTEKVVETIHNYITNGCEEDPEDGLSLDSWDLEESLGNSLSEAGLCIYNLESDELKEELLIKHRKYLVTLKASVRGMSEEEYREVNKFTKNFSFSDEDGPFWSSMEHGGVFRNVEHEMESHH